MVRVQNDCCDCAVGGFPCLGSICSLRHNPHYYCDLCGEEIMDNRHCVDGLDVCDKCYEEEFEDGSEAD